MEKSRQFYILYRHYLILNMEINNNESIEEQRKLGKFTTPRDIAKFITKWAIKDYNDIIFEPCIGSGNILYQVIEELEHYCSPTYILNNFYGLDIDPFAVDNIMKQIEIQYNEKPNIICADFLKMTPNKNINYPNYKGMLPLSTVILCNPPYTRHQLLDRDYKEEIAKIIEKESGLRISRRSSLYVYFLIHSAQFIKEEGRMAFIIPSSFLDVDYGISLKQFLIDNFRIDAIILFPIKELLFPKVLTTTCIVLLEKNKDKKNIVNFVKLNSLIGAKNLLRSLKDRELLTKKAWGTVYERQQISLDSTKKWSQYFDSDYGEIKGVLLKEIARVKRGIATGANDFFTLSDNEVQKYGIEDKFLKPVLKKARDASFFDFTKEDYQRLRDKNRKVWLVSSDLEKDKLHDTDLLKYIKQGETQGLSLRYLTSSRRIWYSLEKREPSPIIFTYMSRNKPRFISNKANIAVLNTFLTIYPKELSVKNEVELKALLAYLNSDKSHTLLKKIGRMYGGGLLKVEPGDLETLPVLNLQGLENNVTKKLASLFDELCLQDRKGDGSKVYFEINQIIDSL